MRILLTGGHGFLGRRLTPLLSGHEVLSLVRAPERTAPNVREVIGDLNTEGSWHEDVIAFAPDCCVHLAWDGLPDYSLRRCRINVDASFGLFEVLVKAKVSRVVVAGSCWEYGRASGSVREDAVPLDCGVFASAKHAIHASLDGIAREAGMTYSWARIFFAYGPGQRSGALLPHLRDAARAGAQPILRTPGAVQDFVHIDDVARGLLMLAECAAPSGVFNIGSGQPATVGQVAGLVAAYYGLASVTSAVQERGGFWADTSHMTAVTGWRPQTGLGVGVEATLRDLDAML